MTTALAAPACAEPCRHSVAAREAEIADLARLAIATTVQTHSPERRKNDRVAYPYPIWLVSEEPGASPFVAIGRHLSELGIDFYSTQPLADRRLIVTLLGKNEARFLLDLTWCRFVHCGLYLNGGRFLKVVPAEQCRLNAKELEMSRRFR